MTGGGGGGFSSIPPGSPLRSPAPAATPLQAQRTGAGAWAVSPTDKAKADRFFDGLDQEHKGVLEGQAAVPFFMQSGLSEATLAHIWDLSDVTQSGSLSRDEFAVAMHLINLKITGSDLPQELPASLVPPNLRGTSLPQAVNPAETDTQRDLFSLIDDDDAAASNLPVSTASAFATPAPTSKAATGPGSFPSASAARSGPFDDDFLGSSSESQTLAKTATPISNAPAAFTAGAAPAGRSLDDGAELGNSRLALDSTQRSLSTLETKRGELQKGVDEHDQSIGDIKSRLESVKLRHQTESEAVKSLTERHAAQTAELNELRQTSVREESELSRLRGEKDELEQALMRDREEVREMKKQASEVQKQRDTLAAEVEKLRKDARMQRGLVAIGKKQLSQAESDMEKTRQQLEEVKSGKFGDEEIAAAGTATAPIVANGEATTTSTGAAPIARGASTLSPTDAHQNAVSPAASVRSNNPFDRLGGSGMAAGAGAGAAAVGAATMAGAVVMHHQQPSTGAKEQEQDEEDPFGVNNKQGSFQETSAAPAASTAFDDNFGNDFQAPTQSDFATSPATTTTTTAAVPATATAAHGNTNQAFDDAFADLDQDNDGEAQSKGVDNAPIETPQTDAAIHTTASGGDQANVNPIVDEETQPSTESEHVTAPTADEVTSDADLGNVGDKGKAAVRGRDDDSEIDSSEEEEEGPEDLENGSRAAARTAPVTSGYQDGELGAAGSDNVEEVVPGGLAASSLPSATTATQAADRFPDIVDDDLAAPTTSGAVAAVPSTAATSAPAADALAPPTSQFETATTASGPGPITAQATGDTDAAFFHDASTGDATTTTTASDLATSEGLGHASQGSASLGPAAHERFSTAVDDSSLSSPATKTRRAPPPAPSRGSTLSTGSGAAAPALASSAVPVSAAALSSSATNSMSTAAPAPATASTMDDFDAAFEDLGPTSSANNGTAAAPVQGSNTFDDSFGTGDTDDFDFVPKFHQPSSSSSAFAPQQSHGVSGSRGNDAFDQAFGVPPSNSQSGGGFDGFDGAFAPPTSSQAPPPPPPRQATQQHPSATASQGSAFSFEDAFAPTNTPPSLTMPGTNSSFGNDVGNATAATKTTKAITPALADDAGPVKQLCGMGFSRESVIKALEKSNYRTEKALERLLAQTS